jgi:hypothetical protein
MAAEEVSLKKEGTVTLPAVLCLLFLFATDLPAQTKAPEAPKPPAAKGWRFSDHANSELPRWFRFNGEYRMRFEGFDAVGFKPDAEDGFLLSRVRLNATISPTSWMRFQLQGQDAQAFGRNQKPDGPPYEDTFDIRQGYVEFGNSETSQFSARVGRQELFFGDQRLVGHLNWTNTARSFDAARVTWKNKKVRVDAFASSVVNLKDDKFDREQAGNNLHGAYAVFSVLPMKGTIDAYTFWRLQPAVKTEAGALSKLDSKTIGMRFNGKLPANFDYTAETAGQVGSVASDDIRAWAGAYTLGYTLAKVKYKPRIVLNYNHASGDKNPKDGERQTFDQLYPTGHDKLGLADQVGWKNVENVRAGLEVKPTAKLSMNGNYLSWWLANIHDGLYNASGALVVKVASGAAGKHVGQEADYQAVYALTPQIQLSGGYSHIFPGTFLRNATPGKQYNFTYAMVTYLF